MSGGPDTVRPRSVDALPETAVLAASALASCGVAAVLVGAARTSPWVVVLGAAVGVVTVTVLLDLSWAAVGLFLVLPVGLQDVGPFEVVELAALGVVGLVVVVTLTTGRTIGVPLVVGLPLGAVLLLTAFSTAASSAPDLGVPAFLQLGTGAAVMVAVSASLSSLRQVRRVVWVLVTVGAGISLSAAAGAGQVSSAYGGAAATGRAEGVFTQPNELGAFTAAVLVAAAGLWVGSRAPAARVLAVVALGAVLPGLVLSLSRGAWTGAVAGLVATTVLVLREARMRRQLVGGWLVLVVVVLGAPLVVDYPLAGVVSTRVATMLGSNGNPHDARPEIYDEALAQVQQAPLLGHGPGSFARTYGESVVGGRSGNAEHAHNLALTLAAELGLAGLTAYSVLAAAVVAVGCAAVRRLRTARLSWDAAVCAGLLGALVTVLGHGLVDYPLRNPTLFLLHWAVAGLVLAYARLSVGPTSLPGRSPDA